MINKKGLLRILGVILGVLSMITFILMLIFFESVRPRMVAFSEIPDQEINQFTWVGVGLLFILCFFFFSLWQTVGYLRYAEKITFPYILLLVTGVLALLFIFADVALLNDIVKQYKSGLEQPEWSLVYPIMAVQILVTLTFLISHITKVFSKRQLTQIAKDSNIFMVVQYIGVICGAIGISSNSLGFLVPHAWNVLSHTVVGSLILIFPYVAAIAYWFLIKFKEEEKELYDEKQLLDVGRSAFLTMMISSGGMTMLFIVNFQNLDGIICALWLPLLIFLEVLLFSLGNIYFGNRS